MLSPPAGEIAQAPEHARRPDRSHGCSRGSPCRPASDNRCRRSRSGSPRPSAARRTSGIRWVSGSWSSPISPSGIGAGGIEIAQRDVTQAIGVAVPVQRALDRELGLAIRVERRLGGRLADRHGLGNAVDRAGRREDDCRDAGLAHRIEQRRACRRHCCGNKAPGRHRFADIGECGEMHDRSRHDANASPRPAGRGRADRPRPADPSAPRSRWPRDRLS